MSRITPVFRPADYPGTPDDKTRAELSDLFEMLYPGNPDPVIDRNHTGTAIAAHSPRFAGALTQLARTVVLEMPWTQRRDLMELAVQTVHLHYGCDFSFEARLPMAQTSGVSLDRIAALPYWRTSSLFDEEQKLVIEYTLAVLSGTVADDLLDRAKAAFGERGAVELAGTVGTFALWAMLINTARPR